MSLSATRSRRTNAGNRWAEALAAAQLESGDAPDPDAEVSGEEFVGRDEEDAFESDFESTDEEEYAKEGQQDGEKEIVLEERAERRAARAKASKSAAAPLQRIINRAARGEPVKKKQKVAPKTESGGAKSKPAESFVWDATRQSRRTSTVKHKTLVRERLKDAEQRKAHITKRARKPTVSKTQDELIAAALELEEQNTKSLKEFLVKEEEKRAAARRIVRMKIEGPLVRWVSRAEDVRVKIEDITATPVNGVVGGGGTVRNGSYLGSTSMGQPGAPQQLVRSPLSQSTLPLPQPSATSAPVPITISASTGTSAPATVVIPHPLSRATSALAPHLSSSPIPPQRERASVTPAPSSSGQRMQVYVEIPRRSVSASQHPPRSASSQSLPSATLSQSLPARPLSKSPLSSSLPLPQLSFSGQVPARAASISLPTTQASGEMAKRTSLSPADALNSIRPNMIRQASVSSTSSSRSKKIMYVELPAPRRGRVGTPVPGGVASGSGEAGLVMSASTATSNFVSTDDSPSVTPSLPTTETTTSTLETKTIPSAGSPLARPVELDIFTPGGPKFAIVLPQKKTSSYRTERQGRNYIIIELGAREQASFGARMRAVFGDHADWSEIIMNGVKPSQVHATPVCAITGLSASYRDPRTGIPYANAYAFKTLTRLLRHEFVWSQEKGCYVGDEGLDGARGVPRGWTVAAAGRF
ncbi:YL1-domain-containing protein [Ceratobasidium sp. AG-I]|nr:YL1-domain-containing protein [Ceratobasidium sp. AG-I]